MKRTLTVCNMHPEKHPVLATRTMVLVIDGKRGTLDLCDKCMTKAKKDLKRFLSTSMG